MYRIKNIDYDLKNVRFECFSYTFNDLPKTTESLKLYGDLAIDAFSRTQWWKLKVTELDETPITFDGDIHLKVEFEVLNEEDIRTNSEFTVKRFTNSDNSYGYIKVFKGKELIFTDEGTWDDESINDLIKYLKPSTSTKGKLILNMKLWLSNPCGNQRRNRMGCLENWYDFEYAMSQTSTIEEIKKMTDSEVTNLTRLATNIQEGLY